VVGLAVPSKRERLHDPGSRRRGFLETSTPNRSEGGMFCFWPFSESTDHGVQTKSEEKKERDRLRRTVRVVRKGRWGKASRTFAASV